VAGADFAHVGPRFGDRRPYDAAARRTLEKRDRGSIDVATPSSAAAFWEHVVSDLEERRVCGLAPIYSLLRVLDHTTDPHHVDVVHYEQTIDDEDGSIVSHAGLAFYDAR